MTRGKRHALRMVAGARRDHPARALGLGHVRDAVVGAAQLVAEDRLQILALEQHFVAETARQPVCPVERRLVRHVVDAAVEDQAEHCFGPDQRFALSARQVSTPNLQLPTPKALSST